MAIVEVTEDSLRRQAGESIFTAALALADQGLVTALNERGASISAMVDGRAVTVVITKTGIEGTCACEAPSPCPHAVATALTWVRTGEERPAPDLYAALRVRDADWLARRLVQLAENDQALAVRLLAEAEQVSAVDELADLRADLEQVMADLLEEAEQHDHDDWYGDAWYPDTGDLEEILDDIDELIAEEPDIALELIVRAIDLIEQAMDTEKVYGEELLNALTRVQGMHLDACLTGSPDPVRLAEWLIGKTLTSGWCSFDRSLADYSPVLGDQGLRRCRELMDGNKIADYKLRTLRESLARE
ncbi:SWIM zinc finger family protein [Sphaerimonospora thailandensis]|nr:hypothetical protein [Sphaerimonospora thailandensis]